MYDNDSWFDYKQSNCYSTIGDRLIDEHLHDMGPWVQATNSLAVQLLLLSEGLRRDMETEGLIIRLHWRKRGTQPLSLII